MVCTTALVAGSIGWGEGGGSAEEGNAALAVVFGCGEEGNATIGSGKGVEEEEEEEEEEEKFDLEDEEDTSDEDEEKKEKMEQGDTAAASGLTPRKAGNKAEKKTARRSLAPGYVAHSDDLMRVQHVSSSEEDDDDDSEDDDDKATTNAAAMAFGVVNNEEVVVGKLFSLLNAFLLNVLLNLFCRFSLVFEFCFLSSLSIHQNILYIYTCSISYIYIYKTFVLHGYTLCSLFFLFFFDSQTRRC